MDRSVIEAKLEALRRDRERLLADLNAVIGAIQLCEQLLAEWTAPEPPRDTKNRLSPVSDGLSAVGAG